MGSGGLSQQENADTHARTARFSLSFLGTYARGARARGFSHAPPAAKIQPIRHVIEVTALAIAHVKHVHASASALKCTLLDPVSPNSEPVGRGEGDAGAGVVSSTIYQRNAVSMGNRKNAKRAARPVNGESSTTISKKAARRLKGGNALAKRRDLVVLLLRSGCRGVTLSSEYAYEYSEVSFTPRAHARN